jgi:hypothetical protein
MRQQVIEVSTLHRTAEVLTVADIVMQTSLFSIDAGWPTGSDRRTGDFLP